MKKTIMIIAAAVCALALCACAVPAENLQPAQEAAASENAASPAQTMSEQTQAVAAAQTTQAPETDIGLEAAKRIALEHAGLDEADVTMIKAELDHDDGRSKYDIDFYSGNTEYEYEIDPSSGAILEYDHDVEGFELESPSGGMGGSATDVALSEDDAAAIALANVPGAAADDLRIHLEYDDGSAVYDGEIVYGGVEYDFEIDADTGKIRTWDEDKYNDDDDAHDND